MGLFGKKKPPRREFMDWPRENISGDSTVYVRGVSFNQATIRQVKNCKLFALAAEPQNQHDKTAVMVAAVTDNELLQMGHLPAGDMITKEVFELTTMLEDKNIVCVVDGYIEPYDGGLGVRVMLPKHAWLKTRLNAEKTPTQS
jgi:hypothetical protein